jgi:hypothetical protein
MAGGGPEFVEPSSGHTEVHELAAAGRNQERHSASVPDR